MRVFKFSIYLIIVMTVVVSGCKSNEIITKSDNKNTSSEKNESNDNYNPDAEYEAFRKRHFAMQSDRTKQMMIRADKNRKSYNSGISRNWYDNLFNNTCFRNSCMIKTGRGYVTVTKSRSCFVK